MNAETKFAELEVGYNIPAAIGMDEADIQTPCLVVDLDALERRCCVKCVRDSLHESRRLDRRHAEARSSPLSNNELV